MDLKIITTYLKNKPGAYEDFPFGPDALVFKIMKKMFALISLNEHPHRMNLKCQPEHAQALRAMYKSVLPGYHMNKEHWNTVILDKTIPDEEIYSMIDNSYNLIIKGLKKADRLKLQSLTTKK